MNFLEPKPRNFLEKLINSKTEKIGFHINKDCRDEKGQASS